MKKSIIVAGAIGLLAVLGPSNLSAQGRSSGHSNQGGVTTGLGRADVVGGTHGAKGRAIARKRGANARGFCPPGQRKKPGLGSRFRC